jgi:DNA invertase Pin-like site-specific DNA recombinase
MTIRTPLRLDQIIRTSKRKRDARSPQQQRDIANACAQVGGHTILDVHDSGRSESGKTMDRASVRAAMQRVEAGETDGVIFALADRIGRAPIEETMAFVRSLHRIGYLVIADVGPEPIDLSDPNVETALVIRLQFARDQWVASAKRFGRSQTDALAAGKFIGPTPTGYERHAGRLREHPKHGRIVREAYRRAARDGLHAAVSYLSEAIPDRTWNTDSARKLLASRVYLGESWIWVAKDGRDADGEKVRKVNAHAHEPLTDLATWTAAQTAPRTRRSNGDYPLSGIARCGQCGGPLVGQLQTISGRTQRYRRYRCASSTCGGGSSINADKLEAFVRDTLKDALGDATLRLRFVPGGVEAARERLEAAQAELAAYMGNPALSALGDAFTVGAEMRAKAVEAARVEFQELAGQTARSEDLPTAGELDEPDQFERTLGAMVDRVTVARGRGLVADRVGIVWAHNFDDRAGVLAA